MLQSSKANRWLGLMFSGNSEFGKSHANRCLQSKRHHLAHALHCLLMDIKFGYILNARMALFFESNLLWSLSHEIALSSVPFMESLRNFKSVDKIYCFNYSNPTSYHRGIFLKRKTISANRVRQKFFYAFIYTLYHIVVSGWLVLVKNLCCVNSILFESSCRTSRICWRKGTLFFIRSNFVILEKIRNPYIEHF